jgi:hypothetical protein
MLLLLPHSPVYGLNWLLLYSWQPEPDNRKPRVARYSPSSANQERQTDDGVNRSADLQITDMAIAPVSGDVEKSAAETLYGNGGE